jgi:hypothetical protein
MNLKDLLKRQLIKFQYLNKVRTKRLQNQLQIKSLIPKDLIKF